MGRWSQRRLAGGGTPATPLIEMTLAELTPGDAFLTVSYSAPVLDTDFTPPDFTTAISGFIAISVIQNDADTLIITFNEVLDGEGSLRYTGTVPNVRTPQTISITPP